MTHATSSIEKIDVKGGHLVEKVKELIHEGNVRRIIIKDGDGKTVMEVPVTVGLVGFFVAPTIAAVGAIAAIAADYSIEVERDTPGPTEPRGHPFGLGHNKCTKGRRRTMERYRDLLDRYVELYNARDLDGVMDLYE